MTRGLALVESPVQLLNVLELSHDRPDLHRCAVAVLAPRAGATRDQLRAMVALAHQGGHDVLWYDPRLSLGGPAAVWSVLGELSGVEQLVVGDPFSGLVQVLLATTRPRPLTLVDDGTATLEFARRWRAGEPLQRWHHARPGAPRPLLATARRLVAGTARRRLRDGPGLRVFTAMPVELDGVEVVRNTYAWVRSRYPAPEVRDGADLVGTSLVETGVVTAEHYLDGVRSLVEGHGVDRYLAHRKETEDKLARISALGVEVVRPDLPLEIVARRGPVGRTVLSFPSTVLHTLPLVLAGSAASVVVCAIPRAWYRSQAPDRTHDFLGVVVRTAQAEHGLRTVAC